LFVTLLLCSAVLGVACLEIHHAMLGAFNTRWSLMLRFSEMFGPVRTL
jgi:hypothetical protein